MSKVVQPCIFIDDHISSIKEARDMSEKACLRQKDLKADLWGLITATPKDIVAEGEDPITTLRERFDNIWDDLWDAFIDNFKYTIIADDAEFTEESLVAKQWEEEKKSIEELREKERERIEFFGKYSDVLSPYNFDDYKLYDEFSAGNIVITEPFTVEQREYLLEEINKKDKEKLDKLHRRLKEYGK